MRRKALLDAYGQIGVHAEAELIDEDPDDNIPLPTLDPKLGPLARDVINAAYAQALARAGRGP